MEKQTLLKKIEDIHDHLVLSSGSKTHGLLNGDLSEALFLVNYNTVIGSKKSIQKSIFIIEKVIDDITSIDNCTLFSGLAGFCWYVQYLENFELINTGLNRFIASIEGKLYSAAIEYIRDGNVDLFHGALGIGLFFHSRKGSKKSKSYLKRIIEALDESAQLYKGNKIWFNYDFKSKSINNEEINLGFAHGIPSILSFVTRCYSSKIESKICKEIAKSIAHVILSTKQDKNLYGSYFPNKLKLNNPFPEKSRLAWCYGDLGVGYALLKYAHVFGDIMLQKEMDEMFTFQAKRTDLETNMIVDAGLCHGTAGIAHIFNKVFVLTKNKIHYDAKNYWLDHVLKQSSYSEEATQYKSFNPKVKTKWMPKLNLIEGISGIGLVLLSDFSSKNLYWDEILNLD